MSDQGKPPSGGGRFLKLAGLSASVAGNFAKERVKRMFLSEERAEQAERENLARVGEQIAATLGQLKGAAMKMGQMASMAADLLPKEIADALQSLQREAPPVDFSVIEAQIQAEFDQPLARLFDDFEPVPFAAASIGQVHRARVDGRDVICKVQYPGVDAAVNSDMRHLKFALLASGVLRVDKRALDASFNEISERMHEELDYCNESDNVRAFRTFHARHPFVVVPEVIGHRSAKRVLTLAYEPGDHIRDFDGLGYTREQRDLCGHHLWQAMDSQIFEFGTIHADPNPANFAFRKDGTVVMYDFGCVKRLEPIVPEGYGRLILEGLREDYTRVEETLHALGIRREGGPQVSEDFYKLWRDWLALPILAATEPFDFGSARFEQEVLTKLVPATMRNMASFQPSKDLVFFNRALVGHYATLRKIRARIAVGDMLKQRFPETAPWFPGAQAALSG